VKVLACDGIDAAALEKLRAAGHQVDERGPLAGDDLARALDGCAGLIVRGATRVTADVLAKVADLKLVVRAGSGLDNVDREAAKARGVAVRNTPAANAVSVAELTFGLLLAFERHVAAASRDLAAGRWEKKKYAGRELAGKRLGLVGFGRIGRETALRARAFGMEVWASDPLVAEWPREFEWVKRTDLAALLPAVDYLSLHVPLTAETRGFIGARELSAMRPDAVLVNCARGGTVDEDALLAALKSGRLRGAALDVFAKEPPGEHPLLALSNVIATPHLGASTDEAQRRAGLEAAEIVIEVLGAATAGAARPA
jgi:D-3-phosphoglycerate dehydrogenase